MQIKVSDHSYKNGLFISGRRFALVLPYLYINRLYFF